jgi:hypothetical protein
MPNKLKSDSTYYISSLLKKLPVDSFDKDIAKQDSPHLTKILEEYARISSQNSQISGEDEELMTEILEASQQYEILEFWLSEVDHILSHHQGDLDEDARESYKDQYAAFCEYALDYKGQSGFKFPVPPKPKDSPKIPTVIVDGIIHRKRSVLVPRPHLSPTKQSVNQKLQKHNHNNEHHSK